MSGQECPLPANCQLTTALWGGLLSTPRRREQRERIRSKRGDLSVNSASGSGDPAHSAPSTLNPQLPPRLFQLFSMETSTATPRRVALLGATGFVGSAFAQELTARGYELLAIGRRNCDVYDVDSLLTYLRNAAPDFLINCAGYSTRHQHQSQIRRTASRGDERVT